MDVDSKKEVITALNSKCGTWELRKFKATVPLNSNMKLKDFVGPCSKIVLKVVGIDTESLLTETPENWLGMKAYQAAENIVNNYLTPINDIAERNIHMASEYNKFGTKDEKEKQRVYQNTAMFRQKAKNVNKGTLKTTFEQ